MTQEETFWDWVRCARPNCGEQFPIWALNYHLEDTHDIKQTEKEKHDA